MAAQTWDTQLLVQIVSTGVGNTASDSFASVAVLAAVQLKPPYSLVFGKEASPSLLSIAAASQATTAAFLDATKLDFTGPVAGTSIQIEPNTTTG